MKATGRLRTCRSASVQGMVNIRSPDSEQHLGYHKGNKNQQIWVSAGRYWKPGEEDSLADQYRKNRRGSSASSCDFQIQNFSSSSRHSRLAS